MKFDFSPFQYHQYQVEAAALTVEEVEGEAEDDLQSGL